MKKKRKPFVHYSTVWKGVGGGLSSPGESKLCNVGKHKVLVSRSEYLNQYGNPIHTCSVIGKNGDICSTSRGTGSATMIARQALRKCGINTKR